MRIVTILTIILILLGLLESYFNNQNIKKIPIRILVNGTRGKTSVTKLLTASFQASGISCISKTTGSESLIIEKDGCVVPFVRKRGSRLTELIPFIKTCANENVDCIIVECMALRLENQKTISKRILKPTHVLITNTYVDHISEIGDSIDKTTYILSQSVPKNSYLFVNSNFNPKYISKEVQIIKSVPLENISSFNSTFIAFPENIYLVGAVLNWFNIPLKFFEKASYSVKLDIGMYQKFVCKKGSVFYPFFSVNDTTSISKILSTISFVDFDYIYFIYNNRLDREYRIVQFSKLLINNNEPFEIIVIGENAKIASKYFEKKNKKIAKRVSDVSLLFDKMNKSNEKTLYIGIGNIQGQGKILVQNFIEDN